MRGVLACLLVARIAGADTPTPVRHASTPRARATDSDAAKARSALAVIDGTVHVDGRSQTGCRRSRRSHARGRGSQRRVERSRAASSHGARRSSIATTAIRAAAASEPAAASTARAAASTARSTSSRATAITSGGPRARTARRHVVEHLRGAVAEVRALYPDVPTLAIGDISAEHGGALAGHVSHRGGLDVDVGFYFHHAARRLSERCGGEDDLDLEATWALLAAFARTADRDDGVQIIFLDYAVQKRLYSFAKARGTPDDELAFLFQYPAGKDAMTGLVRHWPNHANHLHVRFKP